MNRLITTLLVLLAAQQSFGAGKIVSSLDEVSAKDIYFEGISKINIKINKDGHKVLTIGDNVAIVHENISEQKNINVKVKLKEYTCREDLMKLDCKISAPSIYKDFEFVWVKHSDKSKISQKVKFINGFNRSPIISMDEVISWDSKYDPFAGELIFYHEAIETVDPPTFSCSDDEWLKKIFGDQKNINISEWTAEGMLRNKETEVNMNMVFSSMFNVTGKVDGNKLTLSDIGFVPNLDNFSVISENYGWATQKGGEVCDSSFQLDLGSIGTQFDDLAKNLKYKKLKWSSEHDKALEIRGVGNALNELRNSIGYTGEVPNNIKELISFRFYDYFEVVELPGGSYYYKFNVKEVE